MIKLLTLILMLTTGTATAVAQQQTIPAQFQGKWDLDLESCNSPVRADDGSILVQTVFGSMKVVAQFRKLSLIAILTLS